MKRFVAVLLGVFLAIGMVYAGGGAEAETEFPTRNINLIVPFAAGGGTDAVARALANSAEKYLGVPVVVVNRTGGSGAVGMTEGSTSRPDGYTVTMITREIVSLPLMGLAQITAEDFDLIRLVNMDPALLAVREDSRYENLDQLLEDARQNPGSIRFASTAAPNFYILTIENDQNVSFNHIPFVGAAEAIPSVLGGHTDFTIAGPGEMISQIRSGQLRPVAIMAPERIAALPDVPTFIELGYDLTSGTWRGLAVPNGTPEEVKESLERAFAQAISDTDFVRFMDRAQLGIYDLDAESFRQFIEDDTRVIGEIVEQM
jgi:tripartite-type tricarboxylate transporter receptor subunit TctC